MKHSISRSLGFCLLLLMIGNFACKKEEAVRPESNPPALDAESARFNADVNLVRNNLFQNEKAMSQLKKITLREGAPVWDLALVAYSDGLVRQATDMDLPAAAQERRLVYIPLQKMDQPYVNAILTAVIEGKEVRYRTLYRKDYVRFLFQKDRNGNSKAENFFSIFANFDQALFGTDRFVINDGRIIGKKKEERFLLARTPDNASRSIATNAAKLYTITICYKVTNYVYADATPTGTYGSASTWNCTDYYFDDGSLEINQGSTNTSPGGGSSAPPIQDQPDCPKGGRVVDPGDGGTGGTGPTGTSGTTCDAPWVNECESHSSQYASYTVENRIVSSSLANVTATERGKTYFWLLMKSEFRAYKFTAILKTTQYLQSGLWYFKSVTCSSIQKEGTNFIFDANLIKTSEEVTLLKDAAKIILFTTYTASVECGKFKYSTDNFITFSKLFKTND